MSLISYVQSVRDAIPKEWLVNDMQVVCIINIINGIALVCLPHKSVPCKEVLPEEHSLSKNGYVCMISEYPILHNTLLAIFTLSLGYILIKGFYTLVVHELRVLRRGNATLPLYNKRNASLAA
jgi:hypothetical protein